MTARCRIAIYQLAPQFHHTSTTCDHGPPGFIVTVHYVSWNTGSWHENILYLIPPGYIGYGSLHIIRPVNSEPTFQCTPYIHTRWYIHILLQVHAGSWGQDTLLYFAFPFAARRDWISMNYLKCHYQRFWTSYFNTRRRFTSTYKCSCCFVLGGYMYSVLNNELYGVLRTRWLVYFLIIPSFQLAKSKGLKFLETSAKANINIDKAFTMIAEDILQKVNTKAVSDSDVKSGSQRKKLKLLVRIDFRW